MVNNKLDSIQVFRGIAALLVLLFHCTSDFKYNTGRLFIHDYFSFGYAGVDFFFVLSGFIITYTYLSKTKVSGLSVFFKKRLIRIYPVYWLVTLILIPLYFIFSLGPSYEREPLFLLKSFFLINQEHTPLLSVGWTLTHEVKFYLLFGLCFLIRNKYVKFLGIIWGVITLIYSTNLTGSSTYIGFLFSSYNLEFIFGVLSAYIVTKNVLSKSLSVPFLLIGTIAFLLIGFLNVYSEIPILNYRIITYGMASTIIIIGAANHDKSAHLRTKSGGLHSTLLLIGDSSYAIYLIHEPIVRVFGRFLKYTHSFAQSTLLELCLIIAITVAGILLHLIIEKPVIKFFSNLLLKKPTINEPNLKIS